MKAIIFLIIAATIFILYKVFSSKKGVKNSKSGYFGKDKVNNPDELVNE